MTSVEKQFHVPPFPPFPSAERYVRVGSQGDALQRVRRAVEAWEAISLVIGPPGTGKSLICQVLQKHFSRDREVIVFGDATLESPQALQRHLLNRLDRIRGIAPTPPAVGDDPQLAIIERIAGSSPEFSGLLLLVDEAQTLQPEVLETIRILTNVISGGRPRVSAVLLGGPRLDETLALPSLDALVQRVATRCYLHPLSSDETVSYVREVVQKCCELAKMEIDDAAIRSIHRACSGVPRLVNQLMSAAIAFAGQHRQERITSQTVDHAWAVLQQLPGPLVDEPELQRPSCDVEFGPLLDDDDCRKENLALVGNEGMIESCASSCDSQCDPERGGDDCGAGEAVSEQEPLHEFTVQTEVTATCEASAEYAPVSYDCGPIGTFHYDDCIETMQSGEPSGSSKAASPVETTNSAEAGGPIAAHARREQPVSDHTPTPDELFGKFEEEEAVSETLGCQNGVANETIPCDANRPNADADDTQSNDLESSLHREILSLRDATSAPVLWIEESEASEANEPTQDDRDLLVLEDDIEIEDAVVVGQASDEEEQGTPMAVDFQSMLAKMRSPKRE